MARASEGSRSGRLARLFGRRSRRADELMVQRVEEKRRSSVEATEQWLSLLREMERNGETSEPRYETYFRAYLRSKQQEKRFDLELFNMRQGLTG
jgi:hypothetical protein